MLFTQKVREPKWLPSFNVTGTIFDLRELWLPCSRVFVFTANARCGDEADYIVGVDAIEPRNVVDYRKNGYEYKFSDLLINTNYAMLIRRLGGIHDFTSVSVKGTAVVDYAFVSYDVLRC